MSDLSRRRCHIQLIFIEKIQTNKSKKWRNMSLFCTSNALLGSPKICINFRGLDINAALIKNYLNKKKQTAREKIRPIGRKRPKTLSIWAILSKNTFLSRKVNY